MECYPFAVQNSVFGGMTGLEDLQVPSQLCYSDIISALGRRWDEMLLSSGLADLLADGGELAEVLGEFDAVIEDFSTPVQERHFQYEEHLEKMKRRSSTSISDSESKDLSSPFLSFPFHGIT